MTTWMGLMDLIAHHLTAAGFGSGVLIVALISCLPQVRPKTLDEWYAYIRHSLQTAIPAARNAELPPQIPPPDPPQPPSAAPTQTK